MCVCVCVCVYIYIYICVCVYVSSSSSSSSSSRCVTTALKCDKKVMLHLPFVCFSRHNTLCAYFDQFTPAAAAC